MELVWQYVVLAIVVLVGNLIVRIGQRVSPRRNVQPFILLAIFIFPILFFNIYGFYTSQYNYGLIVLGGYGLSAVFLHTTAKHLPEHQFRWTLYGLAITALFLAIAQIHSQTIWQTVALLFAGASTLLAGLNAPVVYPNPRRRNDYFYMALILLVGLYTFVVQARIVSSESGGSWIATAWIVAGIYIGLMFLAPVWRNFVGSKYSLSWTFLALAVGLIPWLQRFEGVHLPVASLWLLGSLIYWLLLRSNQTGYVPKEDLLTGERAKLIGAVNFFISAVHDRYETLFGRRQLNRVQNQMNTIAPIERTSVVTSMVDYCRDILTVSDTQLKELGSNTLLQGINTDILNRMSREDANFLRKTVFKKTTYVSEETTHIDTLANTHKAQFDHSQNGHHKPENPNAKWLTLLTKANLFRTFDRAILRSMVNIAEPLSMYAGTVMAEAGNDAKNFVMIESGTVMARHLDRHLHNLGAGDYFGGMALLNTGDYLHTYHALTDVKGFSIPRDRFEQLLLANPNLALPLIAGAENQRLLRDLPILRDANWQTLSGIEPERKKLKKDSVIIREGQPQTQLAIIQSGTVQATIKEGPENRLIAIYTSGDFFGMAESLANATYRSMEPTELILIPKDQLPDLTQFPSQLSS